MLNLNPSLKKELAFLYTPHIFFGCLIWLMVLLVVGTLSQTKLGIYQSQELYFSSWFIEIFGLPILPGARLVMAIMFFNLLFKILLDSPIKKNRIGTLVIHIGAFCLLLGGFLTAYGNVEGSMAIPEGETSNIFIDYHDLEFAVIDLSNETYDEIISFSNEYIEEGAVISGSSFPAKFTIKTFYRNSDILRRSDPAPDHYRGVAQRFEMKSIPIDPEYERNQASMLVDVTGLGDGVDGTYLFFENSPVPQSFTMNGKSYVVGIRKKQYPLDFSIELIDFQRTVHPGTQTPKTYKSIVNLIDGGKRRSLIEMNEPLRHKGYTFYQASFSEGGEKDLTVLAVVKNYGRMFPYISSIVICIGMFIHLLLQIPRLIAKIRTGASS